MPLAPGARILVMYDAGENLYHERHIVAHIRDSVYLIVTPEGAAYEEDYSNANVEILTVRILMNGAVPGDLRGEPMHRFRAPPTAARLAALTEEAEQLAALRGGGLAAAVAAAPPCGRGRDRPGRGRRRHLDGGSRRWPRASPGSRRDAWCGRSGGGAPRWTVALR